MNRPLPPDPFESVLHFVALVGPDARRLAQSARLQSKSTVRRQGPHQGQSLGTGLGVIFVQSRREAADHLFAGADGGDNHSTHAPGIRDRIIGILLGLTVSSIVYRYIWPDHATDKLHAVFGRALHNIGRLLQCSPADLKTKPPRELYESVIADLAETQQLLDFANFEEQDERAAAVLASVQPRAMVRHAQAICLTAGQLLRRSQRDEWQALATGERAEDEGIRKAAADALARGTHFVVHGGPAPMPGAAGERRWSPEAGDRA